MKQLIYVSRAVSPFSQQELESLLHHCRERNAQQQITGMLLYNNGLFVQALEGEDDAIEHLYQKIKKDQRHTGLIRVLHKQIDEREFGDWSMGFKDISGQLTGANTVLNHSLSEPQLLPNAGEAQKMLLHYCGN